MFHLNPNWVRAMPPRFAQRIAFVVIVVASLGTERALAEPEKASQPARKATERAIEFLKKDAEKWREDRKCASCHHGAMTVWALCEAKSQGYAVTAESLADFTKWTKERLKDIGKPRDTRPGWSMVNTPAVYLATIAQAIPDRKSTR